MTGVVSAEVASSEPVAARDFDGLYKALLEAHPRDALNLFFGAGLDERAVILEQPTELPRPRSRLSDKVWMVPRDEGMPADVYHVEIQVQRTGDFQERMVYYWSTLALKYSRGEHRIHQLALWPLGGGFPGLFSRDQARLEYLSINVPDDLDPVMLLASPLAPLALWSQHPPDDVAERVVDRIMATTAKDQQLVLIELGMLVGGSLAAQVLEVLRRKGMNNVLKQSESGREILEEGREQGLEQGHVDSMRVLLRARFGELADLDELAHRLTDSDHNGNIARIVAGATLAELRS